MIPKTFYITYLNCNTTEMYTVTIHRGPHSTCDDARTYFNDCTGTVPIIILSVWDEDDITEMVRNGIDIPKEVAKHLGHTSDPFTSYEPDEAGAYMDPPPAPEDKHISFDDEEDNDPDAGEEWKKLL